MGYVLYLEKYYDGEDLKGITSEFLGISKESLGYLDTSANDREVYLEIENYDVGFCTRLSVYKDSNLCSNLMELDFGFFLSRKLQDNILMSYWDNNPYLWILIDHCGSIFQVMEMPKEERGIEIDLTDKVPLDEQIVRQKKKY